MLTARGTETDRIVGLELGADDYVVKPFCAAEVIARIRAVLRRTQRERAPAAAREPIRVRDARRRPDARAARRSPAPSSSSPKEFDLLAELVRARRRGRHGARTS